MTPHNVATVASPIYMRSLMKEEQSMNSDVKPPRMIYTKCGLVISSCSQAILVVVCAAKDRLNWWCICRDSEEFSQPQIPEPRRPSHVQGPGVKRTQGCCCFPGRVGRKVLLTRHRPIDLEPERTTVGYMQMDSFVETGNRKTAYTLPNK
uniref:Uncharacterized protein n=1 Tax=Photinus pyralis TaxID=7054 RepID=A0A1Y1JX96_PHOPY